MTFSVSFSASLFRRSPSNASSSLAWDTSVSATAASKRRAGQQGHYRNYRQKVNFSKKKSNSNEKYCRTKRWVVPCTVEEVIKGSPTTLVSTYCSANAGYTPWRHNKRRQVNVGVGVRLYHTGYCRSALTAFALSKTKGVDRKYLTTGPALPCSCSLARALGSDWGLETRGWVLSLLNCLPPKRYTSYCILIPNKKDN